MSALMFHAPPLPLKVSWLKAMVSPTLAVIALPDVVAFIRTVEEAGTNVAPAPCVKIPPTV